MKGNGKGMHILKLLMSIWKRLGIWPIYIVLAVLDSDYHHMASSSWDTYFIVTPVVT